MTEGEARNEHEAFEAPGELFEYLEREGALKGKVRIREEIILLEKENRMHEASIADACTYSFLGDPAPEEFVEVREYRITENAARIEWLKEELSQSE